MRSLRCPLAEDFFHFRLIQVVLFHQGFHQGIEQFPVHLKLDSGMHRLGFMSSEIPALLDFLKECRTVRVKSVYSHLAAAEDPAMDAFTLSQVDLFTRNADRISAVLPEPPMRHILNSAGIERFPQYQFDMVRLGIGIYGISALPGVHLSQVASLKVKILQIKDIFYIYLLTSIFSDDLSIFFDHAYNSGTHYAVSHYRYISHIDLL